MAKQPQEGVPAESTNLAVIIDLTQPALGIKIAGISSPLQSLLSELPAGIAGILAWIPDFNLTEAASIFALDSGAFGSFVEVADVDGSEVAWSFLFLQPKDGSLDAAIGIFLDRSITLGGTPLFGPLLAGVGLSSLGITYATRLFTVAEIHLPPDAPALAGDVPQDFALDLTLTACGSQKTFHLPDGNDGGGGAAAAQAAVSSAMAAPGSGQAPPVHWFPVDQSFGPLTVARIGLLADSGTLGLALDASLDLDVVSVTLQGLLVTFDPATASAPPAVSLDGLAVDVSTGPLTIAGSLARTSGPAGEEFDGSLLIQAGPYAINAAGSYAVVDGSPSLFVYGLVKGEIGGPPAFFVTGLAAGFGVNRALRLPAANEVQTFPLVAAAEGDGATGTQDALEQLSSGGWVPPTLGENWIAAGVAFTSFEMIDGFALLIVEFGKDLVFALLGIATLLLPTAADDSVEFAKVEATLDAVVDVSGGSVSVIAVLTPSSHIIDPNCVLTGGLAFCQWFGTNPHAGDVVFSVGGYHPQFVKPDYYPSLPRLGFQWQPIDALQITGEAYFAITPTCAMGGGRLSVTFAAGPLNAWFIAQADFIMYWRPLRFDILVTVSVGASLTVNLSFVQTTLTVELGVDVHLWGPPFQGIAHVNWWVLAFDIAIGSDSSAGSGSSPGPATTLLDWPAFATTSLPQAPTPICRSRAASGLRRIVQTGAGEEIWVFGGDLVVLTTESLIPAGQVIVSGPSPATTQSLPPTPQTVNVYPMGNVHVSSTQEVCIAEWTPATDWQPGQPLPPAIDVSGWGWSLLTGKLPAAFWGSRDNEVGPVLGPKDPVPGLTGVAGAAPGPVLTGILTVAAETLDVVQLLPRVLPLDVTGPTDEHSPPFTGDSRPEIAAKVTDPAVAQARAAIVTAVMNCGAGTGLVPGDLSNLATEVFAALTFPPMVGPLGSTGPQAPAATAAAVPASPAGPAETPSTADSVPAQAGPRLRAVIRSHRPAARRPAIASRRPRPPVLSALVIDKWSTSAERRAISPGHAANPGKPNGEPCQLWPGWTAVWDLADAGETTLLADAIADLWLVALDAGQHVLQSAMLPAGGSEWAPPPGAWRIVATMSEGEADRSAVGWHDSGILRQVASQTFIGDGCLVRRQSPGALHRSPPRRGNRSRSRRDIGVVSGRHLIDGNATVRGGQLSGGYTDTYLPRWCQAVVVALTQDTDVRGVPEVAGPAVSSHRGEPGSVGQPIPPRSADFSSGGRSLWLHPLAGETPAESAPVRTAPPPGWRLGGVFGVAQLDGDWRTWPPGQEPAPSGSAGPARDASSASRVWWR